MPRQLTLQDPGEGIHEAEIVEILVGVGDHVDDGDTVLTVETDKATSEVASPYAGDVTSIDVEVGQIVTVGDVLMTFADGEEPQQAAEERTAGEEPGSRTPEVAAPAPEERPAQRDGGPVPASPSTRRIARELGVDLRDVEPSGPRGRVTAEDVQRNAEGRAPERAAVEEPHRERPTVGEADRWGPVERQPLRGVRRAIAEQMAASWAPIARVTHHDEADVTDLERLRRRHAERIESDGGHLGLLVFAMKALAASLPSFPRVNASLDDDAGEIVIKRYVHLGIAVDTDDGLVVTDDGLVVPVVRDVDRKSVDELAHELPILIQRTRNRELGHEELQGATFTITNVGPLGGRSFTPMVNHPQVGILGMARARLEQRVAGDIDDEPAHLVVEARYVLPLSFSFDHRAIDGADAARFVTAVARLLGDPERLLLSL